MKKENINNQNTTDNMGTIVHDLEKEDKRNIRLNRGFMWAMLVISAIMIFDLFSVSMDIILPRLFILSGMIFGALYYRSTKNKFSKINYSLPTFTLLKSAEKRHRFFQKRFLSLIGMILLFNLAFLSYKPEFLSGNQDFPWSAFLVFQSVILGATIIGFTLEYAVWYFKQKPIHDRIITLIKDIEG